MSVIRILGAFLILGLVSACASFPGGSGKTVAQTEGDAEAAKVQVASLEAEVARLKSQNARLSNELLALKRERDEEGQAGAPAPDLKDPEPALPPAPEVIANDPSERPNAVVDDAASPALAKTDVPVETAPRLVQPTFASNETVFENEAEGDIQMESVLFGVHLASYRHMEEARAGWRKLQRENPDELGLLEPRVEGVDVDGKGRFLRLIGGGFASQEKAQILCSQLKTKGLFCSVAGFEGDRLSLAENGG